MTVPQALEDHSIRHTRILEALEAERQKIATEVQTLQQSQGGRDRTFASECARPGRLPRPRLVSRDAEGRGQSPLHVRRVLI